MNDIESIIGQCRKGEHRAQMQLYNAFYKRVYNSCFRILRDSLEAEDAMQESFLKALTRLHDYDETIAFGAWLVRIAINTSIDKLRKKEKNVITLNEDMGYNAIADNDSDDWEYIVGKVEQVKMAIEKLPEASRLVINLYLIEGYDHEEMAEILKIPTGTVRVQYMRAKQKLIELI
ncbi:RNA polymerase sigma factor [Dysgonomonas sp. 511]|uniref:RNA polymerase sigma factor n=1 Tax=Dysgonomonas sp. 511 TaxID=2302930 RepID=UPI0013D712F3|nr:sigma-70 family RNA polymerase sigma factor [Dysgonomonas sp. 511]NDV78700.1 sigma-70 family RNA polymerase sigma factor [Dysgonomonas sp. 511]